MIVLFGLPACPVSAAPHHVIPDGLIPVLADAAGPENVTHIRDVLENPGYLFRTGPTAAGPVTGSVSPGGVTGPGIESIVIGPSDPFQAAVDMASDGDTIWLDPGTYFVHDITIAKNLTIRSNASAGGNRANTILDAGKAGRIFNVTGAYRFAASDLTLQNGTAGRGGAVLTGDGSSLDMTSISFSDFSATGAPDPWDPFMTVASGGAIDSSGDVTVTSSSFTRCSASAGSPYGAGAAGGAVLAYRTTIISSSFTDCSATVTGDGILGIAFGGVIRSSATSVSSSTFTGCSASVPASYLFGAARGGALGIDEASEVSSSAFTDCSASGLSPDSIGEAYGGAVYVFAGPLTVHSTTFTGCTAGYGGAISEGEASLDRPVSITSSTFIGCSAKNGGALSIEDGNAAIHFNRLYRNTASGTGTAVNATAGVNATDNWWGSSSDPAPQVSGPVTTSPWLVLGLSSAPPVIGRVGSSVLHASLTGDSNGNDTSGGGEYVPDGIPAAFSITDGYSYASLSPGSSGTSHGAAAAALSRDGPGGTTVSARVDNQTVYLTLPLPPRPIATIDTRDDSGFPSASGTIAPPATVGGGLPLMTVTVNIGGDSKAWQAVVTGTKLMDLIVTGTVQHNAGDNVTAPPGIVYQYISLVPARYDSITKATIRFTVPQSWLAENHIDPKSIVLYQQTPKGWEALPTTVLSTKDGTVYFSAESGGFSLFAIVGIPVDSVLIEPGVQRGGSTTGIVPASSPAAAAKTPVATQTTAPAAPAQAPAGSSAFPVMPVLAVLCCGVLVGGGWYARRWWIRRQNPALFMEYD